MRVRVRVRIPMGLHALLEPKSYCPKSSIGRVPQKRAALGLTRRTCVGARAFSMLERMEMEISSPLMLEGI